MIAGRAWADIVEEEEAQMGAELQPSSSLEFQPSMASGIYSSGSLGSEIEGEAPLFGENGPSTNMDGPDPLLDSTEKEAIVATTTTTTTNSYDQDQAVIKSAQTKEANNGFVKDIVKKWQEQSRPKKVVTVVRPSKDQGYYKGQVQDSFKKGCREFNNNNNYSTGVKKEFDEDDQVVVTYIGRKQGLKRTTSLATSGSPRASSPSRVLSRASSFEHQAPSESSESTLATITSSNSLKTNKYIPPHLRKTLSESVDSEAIVTASALYSHVSMPSTQNHSQKFQPTIQQCNSFDADDATNAHHDMHAYVNQQNDINNTYDEQNGNNSEQYIHAYEDEQQYDQQPEYMHAFATEQQSIGDSDCICVHSQDDDFETCNQQQYMHTYESEQNDTLHDENQCQNQDESKQNNEIVEEDNDNFENFEHNSGTENFEQNTEIENFEQSAETEYLDTAENISNPEKSESIVQDAEIEDPEVSFQNGENEDKQTGCSTLNANAANFEFNVNATNWNPVVCQDYSMYAMPYPVMYVPPVYDPAYGYGYFENDSQYYEYDGQQCDSYGVRESSLQKRSSLPSFGKHPRGRGGFSYNKGGSQSWRRGRRSRDLDSDWKAQKENRLRYSEENNRVICATRYRKHEEEHNDIADRIIEVPISNSKKEKDTKQFKVLLGNQGEKKEIVVDNEESAESSC